MSKFEKARELSKIALLLFVTITIFALQSYLAFAAIDLINPETNTYTNQQNISFEFYANLNDILNCKLVIDSKPNVSSSTIINHDFNTLTTSLGLGTHTWSVLCNTINSSEQSEERNITLELTEPTIVLFNPQPGLQINSSTAELSFVALDNLAENLSCEVIINDTSQRTLIVKNSEPITTTFTDLIDGVHTWRVSCSDWAGNKETSETRNFTVSATPVQPVFSVEISKSEYVIGEYALMTINAPAGTSIRVEVCPNASGFVECKVPVIGDNIMNFPFQEYLPFTNYEGRYILEAFFNNSGITETQILGYEIKNNIEIEIDVSKNPRRNAPVILEAEATGGVGTLNYTWLLSNGETRNKRETNITYSTPGEYTNTIRVRDDYNNTKNKSITLTVSNSFLAEIVVKDAMTSSAIYEASVEIEDEQKETDTNGKVSYYLEPGRRDIIVLKENYSIYDDELDITKDETFTILLEPIQKAKPTVSLILPENNSRITGPTTNLVFKAEHSIPLNCSVYINENNDGFFIYLGSMNVSDGSEKVFGITDLENKSYWWKVECIDSSSNSGMSSTWQFSVGPDDSALESQALLAEPQPEGMEVYDDRIKEYEQILYNFKGLAKSENEAAQALGLIAALEGAIKTFKDTIRDLDSLRFRNDLTDEQKQAEGEKLVAKADDAYQKAPINIELLDSDNYVDYIGKEELEALVDEYLEMSNLTKGVNKEKVLEFLEELQQEVVISTKIKNARISYRDGASREMSVVIREVKVYNLTEGAFLIEIVPKEVTDDAIDIKSLQEFEVLKQDPIIKFELNGDTIITYYFESNIPIELIKGIKTAVLIEPALMTDDKITGFSVRNIRVPGLKGIIYIPLIIILMGGLVFAGVRYGGLESARYMIYRLQRNKNLHYINIIINEINDTLDAGDVTKAIALYEEARGAYSELSIIAKNDIHEQVAEVAGKINNYCEVLAMRSSVDELNVLIANLQELLQGSQIMPALEEYKKIEAQYNQLDEETKEMLHPSLVELGNKIQIMIDNMKDNR